MKQTSILGTLSIQQNNRKHVHFWSFYISHRVRCPDRSWTNIGKQKFEKPFKKYQKNLNNRFFFRLKNMPWGRVCEGRPPCSDLLLPCGMLKQRCVEVAQWGFAPPSRPVVDDKNRLIENASKCPGTHLITPQKIREPLGLRATDPKNAPIWPHLGWVLQILQQ